MEYEKYGIKKFDGTNFNLWKDKIHNHLLHLGLEFCLVNQPREFQTCYFLEIQNKGSWTSKLCARY